MIQIWTSKVTNSYLVEVTAYDSSGLSDVTMVTITVYDVNEKPTFSDTTASVNITGTMHAENNDTNSDGELRIGHRRPYTATDDDAGDTVALSLMGDDAATCSNSATTRTLTC